MADQQKYVAKTFQGLEQVLADELSELGASEVHVGPRVVYFSGDKRTFYNAIYWSRTAISILKPILEADIENQNAYYQVINDIPWYEIFSVDRTFMIKAIISGSIFSNSQYAAQLAKDAIVDHFKTQIGDRPNVSKHEPDMTIHTHISGNKLTVSIDGAGYPLFKRGYRVSGGLAPINEVLAAGIIKLSGWDGKTTFVDPMCGSGTFSIEASLMALGRSPQSVRSYFSIQDWNDYDDKLFDEIRSRPMKSLYFDEKTVAFASDTSGDAIKLARKNAFRAQVHRRIKFTRSSFEQLQRPEGPCTLFLNPPYGERVEDADIDGLYMNIGDTLKKNWAGCSAWIISSNTDAIKHIGLRPSEKITVYNGPLECKLMRFEMYEGSKK